MLPEYAADVLNSFIPAVDPKAVQQLLKEWRENGKVTADLFAVQPPANVCQGDVLGPLPFILRDPSGSLSEDIVDGMLISQSCDYDNDQFATFAPCYPLQRFAALGFYASILANEKTALFYLPPIGRHRGMVADLAAMQPFPKAFLEQQLASTAAARVCSFSDIGYVLFLMKLTVHFMRPQPPDEVRGGGIAPLSNRLRNAAHQMRALIRYVIAPRN